MDTGLAGCSNDFICFNAKNELKIMRRFFWIMCWLLLLLTGCESALDGHYEHLNATTELKPTLSRLTLDALETTNLSDWKVSVVALYQPVGERTEHNTETTTSYGNCTQRYNINIFPCTRTFDKALEKYLPKEQITINGQQLVVDVSFDEKNGESAYFLSDVYLKIVKCAGCVAEHFNVDLACYASDIAPEILQNKMVLHLSHGTQVSKNAQQCGLQNQTYVGHFTRETVLKVIKGHFSEQDFISSYELLNAYFAIPTKKGGWIINKSHVGEFMGDYCPLPNNSTGYDRTDIQPEIGPSVGWKYLPKVEMYIYRMANGDLCEITIDGLGESDGYTPYVRYTYLFKHGQLALLKTEEVDYTERWLRFENGEPLEYLSKHDPDSVAGGEDVLYWHRDAAKEWPERMDYTPDWNEFKHAQKNANALIAQYVANLPKLPAEAK